VLSGPHEPCWLSIMSQSRPVWLRASATSG
jgi:hypothetical protein